MQRGREVLTLTGLPHAVQRNRPTANVPAGQNSTYSLSVASLCGLTASCGSLMTTPSVVGTTLVVGRGQRSVNALAVERGTG